MSASLAANPQQRRFVILYGPPRGHKVVVLARGADPRAAIQAFFRLEWGPEESGRLAFRADGSVKVGSGNSGRRYRHVLECIEDEWKSCGEWCLQELPPAAWHAPCAEVLCGESADDVEALYLEPARTLHLAQHPGPPPPGFVWYLRSGVMVTFHQEVRGRMRVLNRWLYRYSNRQWEPWNGSYEELLADLHLQPFTELGRTSG